MATADKRDEGVAWFDRAVAAGDRWMFWSLRADTLDEITAVVPGRPGVRAVTVRTASGREVTLRRDPADL